MIRTDTLNHSPGISAACRFHLKMNTSYANFASAPPLSSARVALCASVVFISSSLTLVHDPKFAMHNNVTTSGIIALALIPRPMPVSPPPEPHRLMNITSQFSLLTRLFLLRRFNRLSANEGYERLRKVTKIFFRGRQFRA